MTQLIVTSSPDILSGTPVFAGTRVPLIDGLEGGETIDDFLAGFPTVRREQVVALGDTRNADVQNDFGYAYRHVGQLELVFRHYRRALEFDPRHRGSHEYAGEAYLIVNDAAKAGEYLAGPGAQLRHPCEQYENLKKASAAYRRRRRE
jgi:uncharacterized protein (DUF433 family)